MGLDARLIPNKFFTIPKIYFTIPFMSNLIESLNKYSEILEKRTVPDHGVTLDLGESVDLYINLLKAVEALSDPDSDEKEPKDKKITEEHIN